MYKNRRHPTKVECRLFCPILSDRCRFRNFLKLLSYRHTPDGVLFLAEGGLVRVDLDGETLWVRPAYDYQSTPYDRMYDICQEWAEYASFLQDISSSARQ